MTPIIAVLVVDFHHARGPEIEYVYPPREDSARPASWDLLSFQALPDGAHLHEEDYAYFTCRNDTGHQEAERPSVFGISCNRQLKASELTVVPDDVTRSTIQKAIVVLTVTPHVFPHVKDKLGAVTRAYFGQRDFTDREILVGFYDSLVANAETTEQAGASYELYTGMPVRQLVHDFRWRVLVLIKALLLERRVLYFGTRNIEQLCSTQYAVLSLIPGLLEALDFCAHPELARPERKGRRRLSQLRTSDRRSMLQYMGMPLQPFDRGAFFGPYTPLQLVDLLEDKETRSYMIGSSNSLFLHAKDKHCDVLVDVDSFTVEIIAPGLKPQLTLTGADRRWMDALVKVVDETWDPAFPDMPSTRTFTGSEEDVRAAFERYVFSLASVQKHADHMAARRPASLEVEAFRVDASDEVVEHEQQLRDYGLNFLTSWRAARNYELWRTACDDECFDITEPRHPSTGAAMLNLADVQARLSSAVHDLKLDERTRETRAAVSRTWVAGTERLGKLWNDVAASSEEGGAKPGVETSAPQVKERSTDVTQDEGAPAAATLAPASSFFSGVRSRLGKTWQKAQQTVQQAAKEHQEELAKEQPDDLGDPKRFSVGSIGTATTVDKSLATPSAIPEPSPKAHDSAEIPSSRQTTSAGSTVHAAAAEPPIVSKDNAIVREEASGGLANGTLSEAKPGQ